MILKPIAVLALLAGTPAVAQRLPVLQQVDAPHAYYWREMYIPQLTTGPSSVTWSPDSKSLAYSMQGSIWRQRLDSGIAEQLTDGPGYHYQPDWSPDGRWLVFCEYFRDALELRVLDTRSGQVSALTTGGHVNVEPRWSPDGNRLAWVSTEFNKHFHIFVADFADGALHNPRRVTGENRSTLPRYYYSQIDHEISPAWSPDGTELLFVSNRNHVYGTGGFWRMKLDGASEPREIHYEETTWRARPDFSPDGMRLAYASYLGRNWHQLWLVPSSGGDPFPISYGDFDIDAPRWSRDGRFIAFISNRHGNDSLWIQEVLGGAQRPVVIKERRYLKPAGTLHLSVQDDQGRPTPARVFLTAEDGRAYAPNNAWMHADDSYDRRERPFEPHYFHLDGGADVTVPVGRVTVEVMKGFEYAFERRTVTIAANQAQNVAIRLRPLSAPASAKSRWVSGDVHVHMNYAGLYRNTPQHMVFQMEAENLGVVNNLLVNKEQRVPDIAYFIAGKPDPASKPNALLIHGQEYHTSFWGHMGVLAPNDHFLLPDYVGYPGTAAASLFPDNATVSDLAHRQGALVGYVHLYDEVPKPADTATPLRHAFPVDVALGKVDYVEVLGFADHRATAEVWYKLLNCGFKIPAAGGTDAMSNYASLHGPVGLYRVYAKVPPGPLQARPWFEALKQGRTFATNGPLLDFSLNRHDIRDEFSLDAPQTVPFTASMRAIVPIDHAELVCNGKVAQPLKLSADRMRLDQQGTVALDRSGWCVVRAWNDHATYPILDLYPYATTSAVYFTIGGKPSRSPEDAAYFMAWIDRMLSETRAAKDWNTKQEHDAVLENLERARAEFQRRGGD